MLVLQLALLSQQGYNLRGFFWGREVVVYRYFALLILLLCDGYHCLIHLPADSYGFNLVLGHKHVLNSFLFQNTHVHFALECDEIAVMFFAKHHINRLLPKMLLLYASEALDIPYAKHSFVCYVIEVLSVSSEKHPHHGVAVIEVQYFAAAADLVQSHLLKVYLVYRSELSVDEKLISPHAD